MPKNFLIIEGASEFELLSRVIKRFYIDRPKIQLIQAHGDIEQVIRSINAIEKAYIPLKESIYREKLVILIDAPSPQTNDGVNQFTHDNQDIIQNNQFFQIPVRDIEQYYPNQEDDVYGNWRKTQEELDVENDAGKTLFTGKRKKQLAKFIGDNISQQQFEEEMPLVFNALNATSDKAFN